MFRTDTGAFLGSAGDRYTPIQNKMAFEFVDALLAVEEGAHYESAGALGNGEKIWCLARIPRDITIAGTDDSSLSYLMFCTSHDGSLAAQAKITSVRVVCNNTLTSAVNGNGSMLRVKHTKQAQDRLDAARKLMNKAVTGIKDLEEKLNLLALRKMTRES
jgi:phage/plasmid-like protein (TIGR03299 family)